MRGPGWIRRAPKAGSGRRTRARSGHASGPAVRTDSLMGWTQPVFNGFMVSQRWQSGHRRELREGPSVKVTRIGLDIAKQFFELHGVDRRGRVVVRKTLRRERVLEYFSQLPACEVALEACGDAHYWHRELSKLGHSVRLLPA